MNSSEIPTHIGFILDGNRRWAKDNGKTAYQGHLEGYKVLQKILLEVLDSGVKYVSAYVFSTENWQRSEDEVGKLMTLALKVFKSDLKLFHDNQVRLRVLGRREGLSSKMIQAIEEAEAQTADHARGTLALCFNYGGQAEIADAVKKIVRLGTNPNEITPDTITAHLYAPDVPACDVIVRTSGEKRLSNYMLWRSAYSELIFLEKNWPEVTKQDVDDILSEYKRRGRRYGS